MNYHLLVVAKGETPPDLLLKNARMVNVLTGEVDSTNIALAGGWIAGVGKEYQEGIETLELDGLFLLPGFINGHFHLESSLLTPAEYARLALAHGTTTAVIDPHEMANVLGLAGIEALLETSENLPFDFFFMAPSCVPATRLETSGAEIPASKIARLLKTKRVLGLAEVMNFPGVLQQDPEVLEKIRLAREMGRPIDGHAPLLCGKELQAYIAAGIESDHECTRRSEAQEKLNLGMWLMIREGSAAKNLKELLPVVTPRNSRRCLLVLDDLETLDLIQKGELDHPLRLAVSLGLDPVTAVRMATLNPAERFGLKDRGAIVPGRRADLVAVDDLKDFRMRLTLKNGKVAAREGATYPFYSAPFRSKVLRTVKIRPLEESSFDTPLQGEKAWVMGIIPDQILTRKLALRIKKDPRGKLVSDPDSDILKIAVVERHRGSGKIGLGLIQGLGLKYGALATSVAHDSHNVVVAGVRDEDLRLAVEEIEKMQGGLVAVAQGKVQASLPLPVAGLISQEAAETVASQMEKLIGVSQAMGALPFNPFLTLSFMALPVIPELKLTDQGLVDVSAFRHIPLEAP